MRFKGSESRRKKNVVAIATIAFLSTMNLSVYPTTHSKYIDEGTRIYSATVHPLYKGDVGLTLLGSGSKDELPDLEAHHSTYKDAFFKFTFDQNDALTGTVTDTYEMQIEPSGACEILSTSTKGTFDKSKNTITYTSAGTDTSEVIMKCSVSALSKDKQNIQVGVNIKETIVKGEITKVIETYKDGSFTRTLEEYYKDYPLESKLRWSPTYIELPDTLPEGFFEQLKLGTLPNYLQQYLNGFDYDATFGGIDVNHLSIEEQLYLLFKEVWLKEIVSKTYGDALVDYVTKVYKSGNDLFDAAVVNANNASLRGLSGTQKETHVMRFDVLDNFVGYARTDNESAAKGNHMYFSTNNASNINQAFTYYLEKYAYLDGKVKPGTDNYQLLMDYINYFAPNNGIAEILLNNKKVEGLTFTKEDGRLDIDPNILTMANGTLNKIIEVPFASPDMKADLADGLNKYASDILSSEAIEWIRTKVTTISNSVENKTAHEDYIAWYYPTGNNHYFLFHVTGDTETSKAYVQVKPFTYQPSYDVDANRHSLSIEDENTLEVVKALDTYFEVPAHTSVDNHFYVDATVNGEKVQYKIPDRKVSLPFNSITLDILITELQRTYSDFMTQDFIDSLRSSATERKAEVDHFLSNQVGTKHLVIRDANDNYVILSSHSNGTDMVYVTAKKWNTNYVTLDGNRLRFTLQDESDEKLLSIVQALDMVLGITSYGNTIHTTLTDDAFITVTENGNKTQVVYEIENNSIIIPYDSTNTPAILADGLEKYYSDIMSSEVIEWMRTYKTDVSNIIDQHSGEHYFVREHYTDDGNDNNDYMLFYIRSDDKSKNTYVTVKEIRRTASQNYIDGIRRILNITITENDDALKIIQALDTRFGAPLHQTLTERNHIANVVVNGTALTYEIPTKKVQIKVGSSIDTVVSELAKVYDFVNSDFTNSLYEASTLRKAEVDHFLSGTTGIKSLVLRDASNNFVLLTSYNTGIDTILVTAQKLNFSNSTQIQFYDKDSEKLLGVVQALDNAIGVATFGNPIHTALLPKDNYIVGYALDSAGAIRITYDISGGSTANLDAEEVMVNDEVKNEILEVKELEKGQNQILDVSLEDISDTELEVLSPSVEEIPDEENKNVSEVDVEDTLKEKVDDNILASDDDASIVDESSMVEEETMEDVEDVSTTPGSAPSVETGSSLENTDNITPAVTEDVVNLNVTDSLNANLN